MTENKYKKVFTWLGLTLLTTALILTSNLPARAQTAKHYDELTFAPLPEVRLPEYDRYQLTNGMTVYLVRDPKLPLVGGSAIIRTGSRLEPEEQLGLASITGSTIRSGGTKKHPADELNQLLEQQAASVETGISNDSGSASFSVLSEDLEKIFPLFAEVIRQPAFAPEQIELAKTQLKGQINRRNDDPGDIASREFRKLIYGENSAYARTVEYSTLDNISRQDVINFYQTYFRPDRVILGIVGDFEPRQMKALIEENFGDWLAQTKEAEEIIVPDAAQKYTDGVYLVDRPNLTQSNIFLGHLGGLVSSPDYPTLSVMNGVLNGFSGRLFKDIRSRQGLAYSVYGYWSPRFDYPGMFIAGGQTKSESTVPFIQSILEEVDRLRSEKIKPEELKSAKESILNSFVFNFEKPGQTLARLMRYEYYGYPDDFIFKYQRAIKATTIEDIQRAAREYLQPDRIVTLVVGNSQQINPPLSQLDENVKTVDISLPKPSRTQLN